MHSVDQNEGSSCVVLELEKEKEQVTGSKQIRAIVYTVQLSEHSIEPTGSTKINRDL